MSGASKLHVVVSTALIALLLCAQDARASNLTFSEARDLVIDNVLLPSPNAADLVAYGYPTVLQAGQTLSSSDDADSEVTLSEDTWFFWVDDDKASHYGHATRFVFVRDADGSIQVDDREWWPVLDGDEIWDTREERASSSDLIFGSPPPFPSFLGQPVLPPGSGAGPGDAPSRVCIYLISGEDEAKDKEFKKDKEHMDASLTQKFGAGNIHKKISRNNPTMQQVCDDLAEFAAENPPCDKFVFFFTGHGNKDYLALRAHAVGTEERKLTGAKLAGKLKDIPAPQWILIEACHAGAHVPALDNADIDGHVLVSSATEKSSYFDPTDGSYWVTYLTDCINDLEADNDGDGEVQPLEAQAWAEAALDAADDPSQNGQDSSGKSIHEEDVFEPFGNGLGGAFGVPVLSGQGDLAPGGSGALFITVNAMPQAPIFMLLGPFQSALPLKGGTLYTFPIFFILDLGRSPGNSFGVFGQVPPDPGLSGVSFVIQEWFADPTGPHGFTATNGLQCNIP